MTTTTTKPPKFKPSTTALARVTVEERKQIADLDKRLAALAETKARHSDKAVDDARIASHRKRWKETGEPEAAARVAELEAAQATGLAKARRESFARLFAAAAAEIRTEALPIVIEIAERAANAAEKLRAERIAEGRRDAAELGQAYIEPLGVMNGLRESTNRLQRLKAEPGRIVTGNSIRQVIEDVFRAEWGD